MRLSTRECQTAYFWFPSYFYGLTTVEPLIFLLISTALVLWFKKQPPHPEQLLHLMTGHSELPKPCPNFCMLEIMYSDVCWRRDVTNEQLTYANGFIKVPDCPGLGLELNEEACLQHPYQAHSIRHYTGALTDIRPAENEFYF